jgi:hypothetical protein
LAVVWQSSARLLARLSVATSLVLSSSCGRVGFDFLSPAQPVDVGHGPGDGGDGDTPGSDGGGAPGDPPQDAGTLASDASLDGAAGEPMDDSGTMPPPPEDAGSDAGPPASSAPRIAALPYVADDTLWAKVIAGAPSVRIAVLNPNSGVGSARDSAFASRTSDAQAAGISVLGYVTTDYTVRDFVDVQDEIDTYASYYAVDGYFIDQVSSGCGDQPYYLELFDYIKAKGANLTVVLDPGITVPECYAAASDVLVTFQDTLANYESFSERGWESGYARSRFLHLVYGASAVSDLNRAFELAAGRQVGFLYVTDDGQPNPWDTLPSDAYWNAEISLAAP